MWFGTVGTFTIVFGDFGPLFERDMLCSLSRSSFGVQRNLKSVDEEKRTSTIQSLFLHNFHASVCMISIRMHVFPCPLPLFAFFYSLR